MRTPKGSPYIPKRTKEDKLSIAQYQRSIEPPRPLAYGEKLGLPYENTWGLWRHKKIQKLAAELSKGLARASSGVYIDNHGRFNGRYVEKRGMAQSKESDTLIEGPELSASSPFDTDDLSILDGEPKGSSNPLGLI